MDLIEISSVASVNMQIKYILCVIDCFSRFLWVRPIENKSSKNVLAALQSILLSMEFLPNNVSYASLIIITTQFLDN